MDQKLKDKVVIITGGGRDIGRAASIKLAKAGAKVVVNYNSSVDKANETMDLIEKGKGIAIPVQADVTKQDGADKLITATQQAFGNTIHILINNAGGMIARKTLLEMDENFLNEVMKLNMISVFLMMKAAVPHMTEGGSIINLSSLAARNGGGGGSVAYAASKGAVLTFSRGMAKELAGKGIRVNCVSPGLINTTFHDKFTMAEVRNKIAGSTPINREGSADEVADAILFLAGENSSFITGESIEINGGAYFI